MTEPGGRHVDAASFGIGAAPNCLFSLLNVADSAYVPHDYAGLPRTSPGIGAFTPWHDRNSLATADIVAGSELFVDYGHSYFIGSREEIYGLIPFLEDYERADEILVQYLYATHSLDNSNWKACVASHPTLEEQQRRCHYRMLDDTAPALKGDLYTLARAVLGQWPSRTLAALPADPARISAVRDSGGTGRQDYDRSVRAVEDLRAHGTCADHLVARPSRIPDAGRGAFAHRDLRAGTVVAPLPLIHVPDRAALTMYARNGTTVSEHADDGAVVRDPTRPVHQQLLLNYCYGHAESTLLLCPYGIVSSLVNHAPTVRAVDGDGPTANVQLVWSNTTMAHPEWRDQPLADWAYSYQSGLSFDYVALRDIRAGEEVLVDYGAEWQGAWDAHVARWTPVERLIDALNADYDAAVPTVREWRYATGDPNENNLAVNLWCYNAYRSMQGLPYAEDPAYPCRVIARHDRGSRGGGDDDDDDDHRGPLYTVELLLRYQYPDDAQCEQLFDEVLWAVPRDALCYGGLYEAHDTREYATPGTFRHDARIPNHLFPAAWKNRPQS